MHRTEGATGMKLNERWSPLGGSINYFAKLLIPNIHMAQVELIRKTHQTHQKKV